MDTEAVLMMLREDRAEWERARTAFERRLQAIEAVPADRWDAVLEAIARADGAEHCASHRRGIVVA